MSGRLIRVLREAALLTQQEVAERAGVNQTLVSMVECGKGGASPETVKRILTAIWQAPGAEASTDQTRSTAELHAEFDACFDAFRAVTEALQNREGDPDVLRRIHDGLIERAKQIGQTIDQRLAARQVH